VYGIEQRIVLKRGAPSPPSPFRAQLKKGPIRPSHAALQDAANAFNPAPRAFKPVAAPTLVYQVHHADNNKRSTSTLNPVTRRTTVSKGEAQLGDKRRADADSDQVTKKPEKGKEKVQAD